jgi:hypothetical protein
MTEPTACPNCSHPPHLPGTECETHVHHGPSRFHLCLCLARPGAANACPPQMTCQGGPLGYADIWYLQQGHSLGSEDGVISPEVLTTGPASVGFPSQADAVPAGQAPATDGDAEVARLHDDLLASKAEIAKLRDLLGKENQRANDAITREETAEQAAEEAQQEAPAAAVLPATDRAALSAKLWEIAEHHIVAEWICCEPLEPRHTLCAKGYAALGMARTLLVDSPEAWNPEAPLLNAVIAELEQLHRERDLAVAHDRQPYPTAWAYEQACKALRKHQQRADAAEEHRLALSEALGLGTGAPWDAIRERADAVLSELPAPVDWAAVLREEAALIRAHCPDHLDAGSAEGAWMDCHCAVADDMERRLAAASAVVVRRATGETPGPDRCSGCRHIPCGDCFEAAAQLVEGCDTDPNTRFAAEALREEAAKLRGTPSESPAVGSQQPEGAKCPRCGEDLTDYAEDDHVWRTGDDRPYCSGECVIAAHRANLPKEV